MTSAPNVFRAATVADLQAPAQLALSQAGAHGERHFTIRLAPGRYQAGALSFGDAFGDGAVSITFEGEGPAPSVLENTSLQLAGQDVTLRNVVLHGGSSPAAVLDVTVGHTFLAERIAVVSSTRHEAESPEPLIQLRAGFRAASQTASIRGSWIVGNTVQGADSSVIGLPSQGGRAFTEVTVEGSVLAGNRASHGVEPWFTRQMVLKDCLVYEPSLSGAWVVLRSPMAEVSVRGGVLALSKPPIEWTVSSDAPANRWKPLHVSGTELHIPPNAAHLEAAGAVPGKPAIAPADWSELLTAAARLDAPNTAAQYAQIKTR